MEDESAPRWQLILGPEATRADGSPLRHLTDPKDQKTDAVLSFLYDREHAERAGIIRDRSAGDGSSSLSVPDWLHHVREVFPASTAESLTRTALHRYGLTEILADESALGSVEPSFELLRSLLAVKSLVPARLLGNVRAIIRRVAEQLREKFETKTRTHFAGTAARRTPSAWRLAKNFDLPRTIRRNLKHYQPAEERLLIERAYFFSRIHRRNHWNLILVVDQSGSMADSVIHSAVMAGIFHAIPSLRTKLVLFDTEVVDLSDELADPAELLMRVQLGGGTDIARAMTYAQSLVTNPARTMIVLVTDFYEGGDGRLLQRRVQELAASRVTMLGLGALDDRAKPAYHRELARRLTAVGMKIAVMTPDHLARWVAEHVQSC